MSDAANANKSTMKPDHPSTAIMVSAAVAGLAEKGGSSHNAILAYIMANFQVRQQGVSQLEGNVRRAVEKMLASNTLVPGKANGSVKLVKKTKVAKKEKKEAAPKKDITPKKDGPNKKGAPKKVGHYEKSVNNYEEYVNNYEDSWWPPIEEYVNNNEEYVNNYKESVNGNNYEEYVNDYGASVSNYEEYVNDYRDSVNDYAIAKKVVKAKKPTVKPDHPSTVTMVSAAVVGLAEKGGSTRDAILQYIMANYQVKQLGEAQLQGNVRRAVDKLLASNTLVPGTNGGVNGSVKLPEKTKVEKKEKKVEVNKAAAPKKDAPKKKESVPKAKEEAVPKSKKEGVLKAKKEAVPKKKAAAKKATPKTLNITISM